MKDVSIVNEIPLGATQLVIPIETQTRTGINCFTCNKSIDASIKLVQRAETFCMQNASHLAFHFVYITGLFAREERKPSFTK
jgi:hypothetical protein